jgi:hypothetical protein
LLKGHVGNTRGIGPLGWIWILKKKFGQ